MNPLRRVARRPKSTLAPYANPEFSIQKQDSRERVAATIAKYFETPAVFVMPANRGFCAKTIDRWVPNAVFYGTDYYRSVVEKTDAVRPGKFILMQHKSVARYIEDNAGSLVFDAAFLDYKSTYSNKRDEIQHFAHRMLKQKAVLAITIQRGNDTIQIIQQNLRQVVPVVVLEDHLEYDTTNAMICVIFRLEK